MSLNDKFEELKKLDLGRLTLPGWMLVTVALVSAGATLYGCIVLAESAPGAGSRRGWPAMGGGLAFFVVLGVIFYGGSAILAKRGIKVLRDK
jgi:hypothetical protein